MFNFSDVGNEKNEKNIDNKSIIYPGMGLNPNYLTSNSIIANTHQNGLINGNEFQEPKNMQNISFMNSDIANQFMIDLKENNNYNMNSVGAKLPSMSKRYAIKQ